jgi:hypothetical protein
MSMVYGIKVQCSCHLDVLFYWNDVHNEDLYVLHEVFYFYGNVICCCFLSPFEGNAL